MGGAHKLVGDVAEKSLRVLKEVTDLFDKHGVEYCLEGGTLLGVVREQRLLPWDDDMDLTIRSDQFEKAQKCLETVARKYKVRTRYHYKDHGPFKEGQPRLIRVLDRKLFFMRGKVRMDIFVKYTDGKDYYWIVGRPEKHAIKSVPEKFYKELGKYSFDGKDYLIPAEYKDYLTLRYGEWEQQVKEWNYLKDDKARVGGT